MANFMGNNALLKLCMERMENEGQIAHLHSRIQWISSAHHQFGLNMCFSSNSKTTGVANPRWSSNRCPE